MSSLSSLDRSTYLKRLSSDQFDLLVIGGGITGAGIALDASARGLKVALIEKEDFASGTSSKSTKLIHGGLRYLKQLDVGLVREVGRERAIVHQLARHLVVPEKMMLPFTKNGSFGYWSTSIALWIYDILAGVPSKDRRKMLGKEKTSQLEPLLRKDILNGSGLYAEYRTDDARLTIENIKLAAKYGALLLNYVRALKMNYDAEGIVEGVTCTDEVLRDDFIIKAHKVINAAGPWVDEMRKSDKSLNHKFLVPSKGVHIVVPHKRIPVNQSLYIDSPDGRMIFIIPRLDKTYIGTTDTKYNGDLDKVFADKKDVQYLLDAVNSQLPACGLHLEDVVSSWAGLRPLIHEEGLSPSELSRKDEIFESPSGMLSIAGGKLTGYRKMAERIVDVVVKSLSKIQRKKFQNCITDKLPLAGGPFTDQDELNDYIQKISQRVIPLGLNQLSAYYLVHNYGRQCELILEMMEKNFGTNPEIQLARAELKFGIENEMIQRTADFYVRRTGRMYFNIESIPTTLEPILEDLKNAFGWTEERINAERTTILNLIERLSVFS